MFWPDHLLKWSTSSCFFPLVFQPFTLYFSCARYIRLCAATNLARCRPPPRTDKTKAGKQRQEVRRAICRFCLRPKQGDDVTCWGTKAEKKKKRPLPFFFLKALLTGLRVTVAGVAREQVEAQERRKVCESCLYTKLHESQQHKGETRPVVEDWISAYYSFKTSWDSRLTFIRAIANVDFLHFYTLRG